MRRPRPRSSTRRAGFILLFGARPFPSAEPGPTVPARCPSCQREVALVPMGSRTWFTLFFIPIFPISGRQRYCECPNCGAQFPGAAEDLRNELATGEQRQAQEAIALYNSLRASPGNAVALNQLMTMYASLKDHDAAVSAARDFPQALNSSEQCMVTLGRVLLAQERHAEAVRWFEAAAARNPMLGEAHYYKALAHLESTPPEPGPAAAAARAARHAGYPNADRLLREAEERLRQQDA
jgi:tetratricopeptide (TPR) repeat protein